MPLAVLFGAALVWRRRSVRPVLPIAGAFVLTYVTIGPLKLWFDRAAPLDARRSGGDLQRPAAGRVRTELPVRARRQRDRLVRRDSPAGRGVAAVAGPADAQPGGGAGDPGVAAGDRVRHDDVPGVPLDHRLGCRAAARPGARQVAGPDPVGRPPAATPARRLVPPRRPLRVRDRWAIRARCRRASRG